MKRFLDIILSLLMLILFLPILIVLSIMIVVFIGRPVFFFQSRPGLNEKIFRIIKFRTMKDMTDDHGNLLSDEARITRLGQILRKLSLDELPQIVNVIKGEMSFVGPRPLLVEYLDLYSTEQATRHDVVPGLTGWAQVNGRNAVDWEERFKLDVWYVNNKSLFLDLKILLLTFARLFKFSDIAVNAHVSMPKFTGSPERELRQEQKDE